MQRHKCPYCFEEFRTSEREAPSAPATTGVAERLREIADEMWDAERTPVSYDDHGLWAWSARIRALAALLAGEADEGEGRD